MSFDGAEKRWMCGRVGAVNLHLVNSIFRDVREPCIHRSPAKATKMLKPDKWKTVFDVDGKALGFRKALKLIILGGVDPSIRAEVWEFLLGCYAVSTTAEYRMQLRMARRQRYMDLIKQCQKMHPTIGTGNLAYAIGSKVMDMRTMSKENDSREAESGRASYDTNKEVNSYSVLNNDHSDTSYACERGNSMESSNPTSLRGSNDSVLYYGIPSKQEGEDSGYFDFPPLPVTNLFWKTDKGFQCGRDSYNQSTEQTLLLDNGTMHSFQINNNVELVMESCGSPSNDSALHASNGKLEIGSSNVQEQYPPPKNVVHGAEKENWLRISDIPEEDVLSASASNITNVNEEKISEWLWTLHRIVVDVVRTDSHLEFYGDSKNIARMSDILAVYAWVDPATGYCQGMSDLLSPFVILYEDNADAFWCFEMLLRRLRENFRMEGPIGVMKQLQDLWKILELTDTEIFTHLSSIGAESLHFAFRMLLVLFRRELSFNEALGMWEMMWAADFDENAADELEMNCLESLVVHLPKSSDALETSFSSVGSSQRNSNVAKNGDDTVDRFTSHSNGIKLISSYPFCGLATARLLTRNDRIPASCILSSLKKGDVHLSVFCVAAILISNRQKIIQLTHSLDDLIKMFNDKMLKINVKRCIRMAIKLRKKYFYKDQVLNALNYLDTKEIQFLHSILEGDENGRCIITSSEFLCTRSHKKLWPCKLLRRNTVLA